AGARLLVFFAHFDPWPCCSPLLLGRNSCQKVTNSDIWEHYHRIDGTCSSPMPSRLAFITLITHHIFWSVLGGPCALFDGESTASRSAAATSLAPPSLMEGSTPSLIHRLSVLTEMPVS